MPWYHCQMGLNRSTLVTELILVHTGMAGAAAVDPATRNGVRVHSSTSASASTSASNRTGVLPVASA